MGGNNRNRVIKIHCQETNSHRNEWATFDKASEIDYSMTNVNGSTGIGEWIVKTYSKKNETTFFMGSERMVMPKLLWI